MIIMVFISWIIEVEVIFVCIRVYKCVVYVYSYVIMIILNFVFNFALFFSVLSNNLDDHLYEVI